MFTGIITDIGEVVSVRGGQFTLRSGYSADTIPLGASIGCDGCCLTATSIKADGAGSIFTVDVSNETKSKTTLGGWAPGVRVNLERALRAGDELGGHIVSGLIDVVATIVDITPDMATGTETLGRPGAIPERLAPDAASQETSFPGCG